MTETHRLRLSHGTGGFHLVDFSSLGEGVIFEPSVLVFHPENIEIGKDVYIGHYPILKGYYKNKMVIGEGTWIGQQCLFHSARGLLIGRNVDIGPGVKILPQSMRKKVAINLYSTAGWHLRQSR